MSDERSLKQKEEDAMVALEKAILKRISVVEEYAKSPYVQKEQLEKYRQENEEIIRLVSKDVAKINDIIG
jgi:hypothetical protein